MLTSLLRVPLCLVRRLRGTAQSVPVPEDAKNVQFSQQQLTQMGDALARKGAVKSFKDKYVDKINENLSKQEAAASNLVDLSQLEAKNNKPAKRINQVSQTPATLQPKKDPRTKFYTFRLEQLRDRLNRVADSQLNDQERASVRLDPQYLPMSYLKQAQKILHKYDQTELRQIASHFPKMMKLRYRQQKLDLNLYPNLGFHRIEEKLPKEKQVEQIYLIAPSQIHKDLINDNSIRKIDDDSAIKPEIDYTQNIAMSYMLHRAPRTFSVAIRILNELKYRYPDFTPKSMIDFGSGLSSGSAAFVELFGDTGFVYNIEPAEKMRKLSKYLVKELRIDHFQSLGALAGKVGQVDIVYAGYLINELPPDLVEVYLQALLAKVRVGGFLILAEHGSPYGSRMIIQSRKWAINTGILEIVAPCPHSKRCPLGPGSRWCHFEQAAGMFPRAVFGKLPTDHAVQLEKFSYIILLKTKPNSLQNQQVNTQQSNNTKQSSNPTHNPSQQQPQPIYRSSIPQQWSRILFPPMRRGRHFIIDMCSPNGHIERRIIAKSHGEQYKRGRKMKWGDMWLWKTRIPNRYRKESKTGIRLW